MRNFGGVAAVVHKKKLYVLDIMDEKYSVAGRDHMASLFVRAKANRWHDHISFESSTDAIVDSFGLSPTGGDTLEAITLMTTKALSALLHNWNVFLGGNHF